MRGKSHLNCGLVQHSEPTPPTPQSYGDGARLRRPEVMLRRAVLAILVMVLVLSSACLAVSSKVTRHESGSDLLKGKTKDVVISSRGTIQLGRAAEALIEDFEGFEDVWSINSIVISGGTIYFGTSPNGGIYKYSLNQLKKIYPVESDSAKAATDKSDASEQLLRKESRGQSPNDVNVPEPSKFAILLADKYKAEEYLSNEHIFAMATDVSGRLLAGISGKQCRLYRFEADKAEIIFEPNDAKYIFAIATDDAGNIYLGTGPKGKVYMLDSFGEEAELIYDSRDKNILSLAVGERGFVYAGSDTRGLVYKINPRTKKATVLYDSDQPEITALLFNGNGDLHAAATSAKVVQTQTKFASQLPFAGRPEVEDEEEEEEEEEEEKESSGIDMGGFTLKIANTKKEADDDELGSKRAVLRKLIKPAKASYVYRVNDDGFVTSIFRETAVFFCLAEEDKKLLVGTGSDAQLFAVDTASEQQAIIYKDEQASQITALTVARGDVYLGTANPAKLIKLGTRLAREGTYASDLIDAKQPAKWGKLQLDADIPKGCKVLVACRSGNVKDVNDPTFSDWTELVEVTEPVQIHCPLGRFCQYKLVLQSDEDGKKSPIIREVAVASSVPNLAPKVKSVSVDRVATKQGSFKISYKAEDDNDDELIYKIDFRKVGRTSWIELEDELEESSFEWDSKTVEDGPYEVRVTASDERGNTTATKLTGSRVSESIVVDNTGPAIAKHAIEQDDETITLRLQVADEFSVIGKLDYTVDSNAQWINAVPDDMVYDTTEEDFTIVVEKLEIGEHIITVRVSDDVGNTTYKTFEVNI